MTTFICHKCGTENPDDAVNCSQCQSVLTLTLEHAEKRDGTEKDANEVQSKGLNIKGNAGTSNPKRDFAIGCFGWFILSNLGFLLSLLGWSILIHGMDLYVWKAKITPLVSATIWLSLIIAIIIFLFKKRMGILTGILVAFAINAVPYLALLMLRSGETPPLDSIITTFGLPLPISLILFWMSY